VREGWPGFSTGLLPWRKGIDVHVDAPAGLIVQPSPTHRGPGGQRQRQDQEQKQCSVFAPILDPAALLLPLLVGGGWEGVRACGQIEPLPNPPLLAGEGAKLRAITALSPSSLGDCWQSLPSARRTRASSWAPFAAVRPGRQARRGIDTDVDAFSPGQEALSKSPTWPHALEGQDARRARHGGGLLFGYFLLATQEKVTRPPAGGRNTPTATL
jgi:hypothetical protein